MVEGYSDEEVAVRAKSIPFAVRKEVITYLRMAMGLPCLDGTEGANSGAAATCVAKFGGVNEVKVIIIELMKDKFHRKNMTSMMYVLNNGMKALAAASAVRPVGTFISNVDGHGPLHD